MEPVNMKRIQMKFIELTEEEKDKILKTLLVLVFQNNPDEFPILKSYAKYGAQAFDMMIDVQEDKHTWYFKRRPIK